MKAIPKKDLFHPLNNSPAFKKGKEYSPRNEYVTTFTPETTLINEQGEPHIVGNFFKHFTVKP